MGITGETRIIVTVDGAVRLSRLPVFTMDRARAKHSLPGLAVEVIR